MADASAFRTDYFTQPSPNSLFDTANSVVNFANAAQQNKLLGTQNQQAQQDLRLQQLGILRGALGAIAANPNASYDDFAGLGSLVQQGLVSPDFYQTEMAKLPQGATPDVYRQIANKYNAQLATVGERYSMENGIPLGQANLPTSFTNAQGQNVPTTFGQYPADIGLGPATGAAPGGGNALMSTPSPIGGATANGNMLAPNGFGLEGGGQPFGLDGAPAQSPQLPMAAPIAAPPASGGRVAGPSPTQAATWQKSTEQYNAAREQAANWQEKIVPLEKLENLFQTNVVSGQGSDVVSDLAKVASTFGIPLVGAEDQANYISQIQKYASQLARSSGAAANSVEQLQAAQTASPGDKTDKTAALELTRTLIALSRLDRGKYVAAKALGVGPQDFADFAADWASQDPRAFAWDMLSPEAKKKVVSDMTDAEFQKFQGQVEQAASLGLIRGPGGGGGQ